MKALRFLANGLKKRVGPVTLVNLTDLVRSFTSVYQLLPIYPCLDTGDGTLRRANEVDVFPGVLADRVVAANEFHREIQGAVEEHLRDSFT